MAWTRIRSACRLAWLAAAAGCLAWPCGPKGDTAIETFEICLTVTDGPGLQATLWNRSGAEQTILHGPRLQPSTLILTDSSGKQLAPFDQRTRQKFDRSVSPGMYSKIAASGSLLLARESLKKLPQGGYELRWGPYHFRLIPPGRWRARVQFSSAIDWVTDRQAGRTVPLPGVWKGTVLSNEVTVELD